MEPWLRGLYDAEGMRAVDSLGDRGPGVASLELMEAAGRAVAEAVARLAPQGPVRVVCGKGNNGGDGLVAARLLREMGFEAEALLLWPADELSDDAAANLERARRRAIDGRRLTSVSPARGLGRGGRRDLRHRLLRRSARARRRARSRRSRRSRGGAPVVACDIASGVDAATGEVGGRRGRGRRHRHLPRRQGRPLRRPRQVGDRRAVAGPDRDPGGRPRARRGRGDRTRRARSRAPPRLPVDQVHSSGQVTIAGGSRGLTGAVRMSSTAAIRAGAGYATVAVPADLEPIFEAAEVEVMSRGIGGTPGRLGTRGGRRAPRRLRESRRRGARPGPRPRRGLAGARPRGRAADRGAAGDRRRRPERLRRPARPARRPQGADRAHPARGRARPPARARVGRDRRAPARHRPGGGRLERRRSSSSRATTRSSPTASGSRSTRSRRPAWRPRAAATSSPG